VSPREQNAPARFAVSDMVEDRRGCLEWFCDGDRQAVRAKPHIALEFVEGVGIWLEQRPNCTALMCC